MHELDGIDESVMDNIDEYALLEADYEYALSLIRRLVTVLRDVLDAEEFATELAPRTLRDYNDAEAVISKAKEYLNDD